MDSKKSNIVFEEHDFENDLKIQVMKKGSNFNKVCIFIPCFNYKKDVIKFFEPLCDKIDSSIFISFDILGFYEKKNKITYAKYVKKIIDFVKWSKKNIKNTPIYLLAESWACAIAIMILEKKPNYIKKAILWNFPSGNKYKNLFKFSKRDYLVANNKKEFNNKQKIDYFRFCSLKLKELSINHYIDKILKFNLLNVDHTFKYFFKYSERIFEKAWFKILNDDSLYNKIHLIETRYNSLKSDYVYDLYKKDSDLISFIKGHHLVLMCIHENEELFEEIEKNF